MLIIDGDHASRVRLRQLLESAAYEVLTATDGRMALAQLRGLALAPCLVLLAPVLPLMDVQQFLAALRDEPRGKEAAVVLLAPWHRPELPSGVRALPRDASDAAILELARACCR